MRQRRLKLKDRTVVYHCISRCVAGQFLFQEADREHLRGLIRRQADFCGVEVVTHAVMSNHFHVEVRVPLAGSPSDAELVRRAGRIYRGEDPVMVALRQSLQRQGALSPEQRERLLRRMGDVSVYMKELKQRFSRWYNRRHDRFGTLWAERFRSVVVEDLAGVVGMVAAYIDLNAVRAGLTSDPGKYRWSGYGEALGGEAAARAGLLSFLGTSDWEEGQRRYRQQLYLTAAEAGQAGQAVLGREAILKELRRGGRLEVGEALRLRIRYLSDGLVLGSEEFVNELFGAFRGRFGPRRRTGARKLMRGLPFETLRTMRDLRVDVVG